MCAAIFGYPSLGDKPRIQHPHDPDDFGRCYRFYLAAMCDHEGKCRDFTGKLALVAALSPVWKNIIDNWSELTRLYLEELPTGRAPKLYERMKALGC
jgi:hypothetical protein